MGERVITIVGGKPDSGVLLDLPHPGSKVNASTGKVPLAKFLLAEVPGQDGQKRHELFEVMQFSYDKGRCALIEDRLMKDGKLHTVAKIDLIFVMYLVLQEAAEKFTMLDGLLSSCSEKYPDFRKLSQIADLGERVEVICEKKDVGMGSPLFRLCKDKLKSWVLIKLLLFQKIFSKS